MFQHALLGSQAQIFNDCRDIDANVRCRVEILEFAHASTIHAGHALRSTAIGDVRAIRNVPTHPENATSAAAATMSSSNGPTGGQ